MWERYRGLERRRLAPEAEVLAPLVAEASTDAETRARIVARASRLMAELREAERRGWVNRFLHRWRLNSEEGRALLQLAEAFLRVPDPATADALIADKIGSADWEGDGADDSLLTRSATWSLMLSKALVEAGEGPLARVLARAGEPFLRAAVGAAIRAIAGRFVMGRTIGEALERARQAPFRSFRMSFDMLGEAARTTVDAERYFAAYAEALRALARDPDRQGHGISVKLSALHPRFETAQAPRAVPEVAARVAELARQAAAAGVGLMVDAEEQHRLLLTLEVVATVARMPALRDWDGLGFAIQAYGKRARALVDWAEELAHDTGRLLWVRLVKGAYWDTEIQRAQAAGLPDYPVFTRKAATDVSYLACARALLACARLRPAFASHNPLTVATILEWAGPRRDFEFQRLFGMGEGLYEGLVAQDRIVCRLYAPVGGHRDLLAYLVRRLLENGANTSFLHQMTDPSVPDEALLADPVARVRAAGLASHPAIPRPPDLFGRERRNSEGLDLDDPLELERLVNAVAEAGRESARAGPIVGGVRALGPCRAVRAPFDPGLVVGEVCEASARDVGRAVSMAAQAQPAWDETGVDTRARALERLADRLEADRPALIALLQHEAGKTLPDALAEVREAVDFCRYYAAEARALMRERRLPGPTGEDNRLRLRGRGVWATVAPWNFPLAIFLGQTVAALVTGNAVVAKPAPQTPLVAARAIAHAHAAGIPPDVLHLLPGGADVGEALIRDARVVGVAFTGSTATAKAIARGLLEDPGRPIPALIAETGGINAMIVDSTALPEQVVADVLTSAFRSAGQRCSALRLLLLQEDVAAPILRMLEGAMDTLVVGDPRDPATDVGPVIDRAARDRLLAYLEALRPRVRHCRPVPANGWFVPPALIELERIDELDREWFGPLLHVAAWKAGDLEHVIARVNAKGYGLTMGVHSRIAAVARTVERFARVGNLYVNRPMIGAVVGSQPFGGEGLSGTGPKAGGPFYLPRFCVERVTSVDLAAGGGNTALLSLAD
ncbi:MAG: bifunctional proline dehydrogenase/L-glutamate gamma-semialdehyde dehydrogenase PutA [Sphingomonadaceae bacterium]|nr:bifunctional proline dehydrogenase/L-glutamate gamma-semialdehyde dehydrogenase PutA [Sphingomonadaceae bacterium]MDW8415036.1 bifunctional proline dehydrogenase/L-glutamate gamma-semialdehyde dehydrogenase PutA [Thermaurantiacus sp.]